MRCPRVRFTVRRLMAFVAVVGLVLMRVVPRPCPHMTLRVFNETTGGTVSVSYKWRRFARPDDFGTAALAAGEVKSFEASYCNNAEFGFTWMAPNGRENHGINFRLGRGEPTTCDVHITASGLEVHDPDFPWILKP
jgi:hypothetical protein